MSTTTTGPAETELFETELFETEIVETASSRLGGHPVVFRTIARYSQALDLARDKGLRIGVVPTMGALHAGHASLIRRAAEECDLVAVSIFVNPTQFGNVSDLANYPRTIDADLAVVADAGGQLVFAPEVAEMYPPVQAPACITADASQGGPFARGAISVPTLGDRWEGASRPGHFDGVATVVVKLLSAAGPCRAYFGEKDFQQLALVRRVVTDRSLLAEVVGCETVRDADGLALSSRNVLLSVPERAAATVLHRALRAGRTSMAQGEEDPRRVEQIMALEVAGEPLVDLDYAVVVQADDLDPASTCANDRPLRLLIAARVGPVRLIDNLDPRRVRA